MTLLEITCANPRCGVVCLKRWQPSKPQPQYCSLTCVAVHRNALRHAAGYVAWRKYTFTPAMNDAIRRASRQRLGALKALWRDDPRFQAAGVPYPLVKRQGLLLGCVRTTPGTKWAPEERAYALNGLERGMQPDALSKAMRKLGWHRSPGALVFLGEQAGMQRHSNYLSLNQIAQGLGIDSHVPARWVRQGLLQVHHTSDANYTQYVSYPELRRFLVTHPLEACRGVPDCVWIIGILTTPSAGHTTTEPESPADDGTWMNGVPVDDRAAAD